MTGASATVVWDPRFRSYDFGEGHPFSEAPRAMGVELLRATLTPEEAPAVAWVGTVAPASREELERFHETAYLEFVERAGAAARPAYLDQGDTPAFAGCSEAAARIVGGATAALAAVESTGRPAVHPAGGLHHAHPARASGFCIFNDLAVVLATELRKGRRVAYLDVDAHHGDGVMYGFYGSGRLLDIDFHQDGRTLFPGTGFPSEIGEGDGAGLKVNVPLPPTAGDEAFLPLFRRLVPPLVEEFRPDLIVVQHGVDAHIGDPLAELQLTPDAYAEVDATVARLAQIHARGRLLVTGGGGYRPASVSRVLAQAIRSAAGLARVPREAPLPDAWRAAYTQEFGEASPRDWGDAHPRRPSQWTPEHESALVAEIESRLGRRFPRSEP